MQSPDPWSSYWRETAGNGRGCSTEKPGVAAAQERVWREFGRQLPAKARVLDLATGNGAVLRSIRAAAPKAHLTGVDSATDLGATSGERIELRAGVSMETLPFRDGSFEAVTSQFGYEYGDTARAAAEVARVLATGGQFHFLIHDADGPIVRQGGGRLAALLWTIGENSPLRQAEAVARTRQIAPIPVPPELRQAPKQAAAAFPDQSAGSEVMTGMLQILDHGGDSALPLLGQLRAKVRGEASRLEALQRAACDARRIAELRSELGAAGLGIAQPTAVCEPGSSRQFAWLLSGERI